MAKTIEAFKAEWGIEMDREFRLRLIGYQGDVIKASSGRKFKPEEAANLGLKLVKGSLYLLEKQNSLTPGRDAGYIKLMKNAVEKAECRGDYISVQSFIFNEARDIVRRARRKYNLTKEEDQLVPRLQGFVSQIPERQI